MIVLGAIYVSFPLNVVMVDTSFKSSIRPTIESLLNTLQHSTKKERKSSLINLSAKRVDVEVPLSS